MAKNKTAETAQSVDGFISKIADEVKRDDAYQVIEMMQKETGFEPKMWGPSIIGFGSYHYQYESGREGDMPLAAFSPRSTALVLYLTGASENAEQLKKLGKYKRTNGCVYIKKLADVDTAVLKKMIAASCKYIRSGKFGNSKKKK